MPICTTHFSLTCNPGISSRWGHYFISSAPPSTPAMKPVAYSFFPLVYLEGLPTISPLRRRSISIPPQHHEHLSLPHHKTISLSSHRSHNLYYHLHIRTPLFPKHLARHLSCPQSITHAASPPNPSQINSNPSFPDSHPYLSCHLFSTSPKQGSRERRGS